MGKDGHRGFYATCCRLGYLHARTLMDNTIDRKLRERFSAYSIYSYNRIIQIIHAYEYSYATRPGNNDKDIMGSIMHHAC